MIVNEVMWIERAIAEGYFKYYEYEHFSNIEKIGNGSFGKVCRANWKKSEQYLALKSFSKFNNSTAKEIICEANYYHYYHYYRYYYLVYNFYIFIFKI